MPQRCYQNRAGHLESHTGPFRRGKKAPTHSDYPHTASHKEAWCYILSSSCACEYPCKLTRSCTGNQCLLCHLSIARINNQKLDDVGCKGVNLWRTYSVCECLETVMLKLFLNDFSVTGNEYVERLRAQRPRCRHVSHVPEALVPWGSKFPARFRDNSMLLCPLEHVPHNAAYTADRGTCPRRHTTGCPPTECCRARVLNRMQPNTKPIPCT